MSESDVRRMLETLYGENGLLVVVAKMHGGISALKWMVGIVLLVVGLMFSYLTYITQARPNHSMLMSDKPVVAAYSDAEIPLNP